VPGFKGGDRTSLDLPKPEEDLLEALKGAGKPLVVVLMNGSALSVNWANDNANAILDAWYSGEEGGTAIAETLAGVNNPAGRLPVTFYKSVDQLPAFEDYSMKNRTYRYFEGQPLYPFGYGLSYSKFEYSNPHTQIYYDVTDDKGDVEHWVAETTNPAMLNRVGWSKDSLKPGDQVTLFVNPNKVGAKVTFLQKVVFPDGKELTTQKAF